MLNLRVWDTVKKAMHEVQAIVYTEQNVYPIYSKTIRRYIPFAEAILMQSTGVHDANGKEIFESDVVSWIDAYGILHFGVVEFTKGMFLVNGDEPVSEAMEVIGNIYEHPDLVED